MKTRERDALKTKSETELTRMLTESKEKLWALNRDRVAGKVKNVHESREMRRLIARLLTLITWKRKNAN